MAITVTIVDRAMKPASRHGLRGYDAVHFAAALAIAAAHARRGLSARIFVTADGLQRAAAAADGLPVDDPNAHP